jgi:crotonobetainyl-CoA:carnitine CoA-transferase CaiB-like acyl-CoA transferase
MSQSHPGGLLAGLRVLDASHQYAGALAGALLADMGAEVVAIEHPEGSSLRTMLPKKNGQSMWWKVVARGKKAITLKLSDPRGRDILLQLARGFDVLIENFRPGTMEAWGLGPQDLERAGANVVFLRVSGFGQTGPDRDRPGFGSLAEAMSGFAFLTGFPDGPPVFPSTTLADGLAGTFGAYGVMAAMFERKLRPPQHTQVIDVALFEPLFRLIPTQVLGYDQLGHVPTRPGNYLGAHGILRNLYRCSDGAYFVISAVGTAPIHRVLAAVGAQQLADQLKTAIHRSESDDFATLLARGDDAVARWAMERTFAEVKEAFTRDGVAFQGVSSVADIVGDPQFIARDDLIRVADQDLGSILMPGIVPKAWGRPSSVSHAGRPLGADNATFYGEALGLSTDALQELSAAGVI